MRRRHGLAALLAGALVLGFAAVPSGAQDTATKEKKVRKLLELTNQAQIGKQIMDQMMDSFAKNPSLPAGFAAKFKQIAKPEDLTDMTAKIYVDHLPDDALDAAIAFFESPGGKAFTKAQPEIQKASVTAGQKWGQEIALKAMKALQDEQKGGPGGKKDDDDDDKK